MSDYITRHPANPILTAADIPFDCVRCFNPAAERFDGKYVLLVRVIGGDRSESIALATGDDGVHFEVAPEPIITPAPEDQGRLNDPRLTRIGDTYYICYCTDPPSGIRIGIIETRDFRSFRTIYRSEPDNRNAVLFPEKIGRDYVRLDRPFTHWYYLDRAYDIWLSRSPDLRYWGGHELLLSYADVPWGNNKIGPGAQPIRTPRGWLVIYHGAEYPDGTDTAWRKTYRAGVMLLDLENPARIIARPTAPLLSPEAPYETDTQFRPNVVFPTGAVVEDNGRIKLYYGAADKTIAMAETSVEQLLEFCLNPPPYEHPRKHPPFRPPLSRHA
ncbi:MAG: 1,4-beta-mannosyl-N-acetylglucosamine phosphorylase [Phycisphaerae bacterium]|nr:1,4-beta-mannosyl-N-acetylglucosamine phosphorylase [Phycisphaerae bacterium]